MATFLYNYGLRGGFLDGTEGLLQHLLHAHYVSWKYAKMWDGARSAGELVASAAPETGTKTDAGAFPG